MNDTVKLNDGTQLDGKVVKVMRAIRDIESGGNYNAVGDLDKGVSRGAYQFNKDNFRTWASQNNLDPNDFSVANQNKVAYARIKKLKDEGKQPEEIAAIWNGAKKEGNKYTYINPAYGERFRTALQKQQQPSLGYQTTSSISDTSHGAQMQPEKKKGFLESAASDISSRIQKGGKAISDTVSGKINPISGVLQTAGAVAGGIGDIATNALGAVTPDFIEKPVTEATQKVVGAAANTDLGQSVIKGASDFATKHPELAADISAVGDIASVVPVVKGASIAARTARGVIPTTIRGLAKTEGFLGEAAKKSLVNEALDIVSPKQTASIVKKGAKAGRGNVSGVMKNVEVAPDSATIRAATAAAGIVKKDKTLVENMSAVNKEIGSVANKLKSDLAQREIVPIVSREELDGVFKRTLDKIGENPTLVGNAEESAKRILKKFQSFLPEGNDITASELLDARKKLDKWIGSQTGGGTVFDPAYENAKTIALRAVRQEANDLIATKAPDIAVKEMLARQSALYDAIDNMATKVASEVGTNRIERFATRHPLLTKGAKYAGAGIVGGLGFQGAANLINK